MREVELFAKLTSCRRKDVEYMKAFTARFNNVVSLYTRHLEPLTP